MPRIINPLAGAGTRVCPGGIGLLLAMAWLLAACGPRPPAGAVEGETSMYFVPGRECFPGDDAPIDGPLVYVSPTGDDSQSCASEEQALRSSSRAACRLVPGQTLRLLPGVYRESVILGMFGDPEQPITFQGVIRDGQRPVLDGGGELTMGIALVESQNVVVEGLEFRNYTDEGLLVLLGSKVVIRDNRFVGNGRGSIEPDYEGEGFGVNLLGVREALVEGNEAYGNGPSEARQARGLLGTGINTYELKDSVIRDNYSHDNIGGGILVEDGENVLVEGNRIEANWLDAAGDYWDGGIWVDGGRKITLRGNLVVGNHGPGIELSDEDVQ